MIPLVKQAIDFYLQKMSAPVLSDLDIENQDLIGTKGSCFVTVFLKGEVRGSAGNIKETGISLAEELITNTIHAISSDTRFKPLSIGEAKDIKVRVDLIKNRKPLARTDEETKNNINTLSKIDPVKNGVIVIKKDYSKTATILPNIDPKILVGTDYQSILSSKLDEDFDENKYIIYEIETIVERDY